MCICKRGYKYVTSILLLVHRLCCQDDMSANHIIQKSAHIPMYVYSLQQVQCTGIPLSQNLTLLPHGNNLCQEELHWEDKDLPCTTKGLVTLIRISTCKVMAVKLIHMDMYFRNTCMQVCGSGC